MRRSILLREEYHRTLSDFIFHYYNLVKSSVSSSKYTATHVATVDSQPEENVSTEAVKCHALNTKRS